MSKGAGEEPESGSRLAEARARYAHALEGAVENALETLRRMPEVQQVILFGSYAAGRRDLLTDLDLVVVMKSDQDFVARTAELYQQLELGVDLDLLVYTPAEFAEMSEHGFLKGALAKGKVLYEKDAA